MESLFTGSQIIEIQQTESSNNYALELIKQGDVLEGLVITVKEQLAGKGQRGSIWHAEAGKNLTFSVVYRPTFLKVSDQFQLNKLVSLAIMAFVKKKVKEEVKIKWPNDIYVGDKKIAGILIENTLRGNAISESVIGVGININQEKFPEYLPKPISLKILLGQDLDLSACLKEICSFIEVRYLQLKNNSLEKIEKDYQEALYRLDEFAIYEIRGEKVEARIIGTNEIGALKLQDRAGKEYCCDLKELVYL